MNRKTEIGVAVTFSSFYVQEHVKRQPQPQMWACLSPPLILKERPAVEKIVSEFVVKITSIVNGKYKKCFSVVLL